MRLIVDTDTASDDAVALLLAARDEQAELVAVTTVAGNVPLPMATRNALITLERAGVDVPVYPGCDRPILRELGTAQEVHGTDGLGDIGLPDPHGTARQEHAVDILRTHARDDTTLVAIGPLTNLAAALLRDRDLLRRYQHVYCMIGAPDAVGNVTATAEYNAWADPEAAEIVIAAADPDLVTWIGWDVSRRDAVITQAEHERLLTLGPLAEFATRINRVVAEWAETVTNLAGYDLPDPIAMAVALRPDLVREAERAYVRVACTGEVRGQTYVDRRATAPPANVTLVRRVDEPGFKQLLFDLLTERQ